MIAQGWQARAYALGRALRPVVVTLALLSTILLVGSAIASGAAPEEQSLARAVQAQPTAQPEIGSRVAFEVVPAQPTPPAPTSPAPTAPAPQPNPPQPSPRPSDGGFPVTGTGPVPAWLLVVGSLLVLGGLLLSAVSRRRS